MSEDFIKEIIETESRAKDESTDSIYAGVHSKYPCDVCGDEIDEYGSWLGGETFVCSEACEEQIRSGELPDDRR